jgi:inward rectifier potassium channel
MRWPFARARKQEEFELVGVTKRAFGDPYDLLLRTPWWVGVSLFVSAFLAVNALFALAYTITGGISGARPHSWVDSFFFSVQTLGTLGYGAMFPVTLAAHILVTVEVILGVFVLALATGVIFSKFSSVRARVQFADHAVITLWNGVPTLMFRLGNERRSRVINAWIRVVVMRSETTLEGVGFYRMADLTLERDRNPSLARSWTVMHRITEASPLWGATPESLAKADAEIVLSLTGLDETSAQALHANGRYPHQKIRWGSRHADILTELPDGRVRLDMTQFHELQPTAPSDVFPYPRASPAQNPAL